jgi:hypothetical protein
MAEATRLIRPARAATCSSIPRKRHRGRRTATGLRPPAQQAAARWRHQAAAVPPQMQALRLPRHDQAWGETVHAGRPRIAIYPGEPPNGMEEADPLPCLCPRHAGGVST